jgi:hypothetical protein
MSGIFSKAIFWIQAKNRHGIHSPFVYEFLDSGLYAPNLKKGNPNQHLVRAALAYFGPERIWRSDKHSSHTGKGQFLNPDPDLGETPFDFFVFKEPSAAITELCSKPHLWHNDSMVYVGNLRASPKAHALWSEIAAHSSVRVVVETYREGLLFFRKQQARQHFKIRT